MNYMNQADQDISGKKQNGNNRASLSSLGFISFKAIVYLIAVFIFDAALNNFLNVHLTHPQNSPVSHILDASLQ